MGSVWGLLSVAVVALVLMSVVNWKAPHACARKLTKAITFMWTMYMVFAIGIPSEGFLWWLEETEGVFTLPNVQICEHDF